MPSNSSIKIAQWGCRFRRTHVIRTFTLRRVFVESRTQTISLLFVIVYDYVYYRYVKSSYLMLLCSQNNDFTIKFWMHCQNGFCAIKILSLTYTFSASDVDFVWVFKCNGNVKNKKNVLPFVLFIFAEVVVDMQTLLDSGLPGKIDWTRNGRTISIRLYRLKTAKKYSFLPVHG